MSNSIADPMDDPEAEGREAGGSESQVRGLAEEYSAALAKFLSDPNESRPAHAHYLRLAGENRTVLAVELYLADMSAERVRQAIPARWKFPLNDPAVDAAFSRPPKNGGQQYVLIRELGSGGAGKVFLGRDNVLQRDVAIKVFNPMSEYDLNRQEQLERELKIAAGPNHPCIVPIFFAGEYEDCKRFAAMQYVEGKTLKERIAEGVISTAETVDILLGIAEAVTHAHDAGLLAHRDLKPANILLDRSNKPHVADFGIALTRDDLAGNTLVQGSRAYMAPEQFDRGSNLAGCDIWALGVIMYEMLTGQRPFRSESGDELIQAIKTVNPPPPDKSKTGAAIDDVLATICMRCLRKNVPERCGLSEFIDALLAWQKLNGKAGEVKATAEFTASRRQVLASGGTAKAVIRNVDVAKKQICSAGGLAGLSWSSRTIPRPPGVECYDVGHEHELLVTRVGNPGNVWLFLFVGPKYDVEAWLESHQDYQWVRSDEGTVDFVRCSQSDPADAPPIPTNDVTPAKVASTPLFSVLTQNQWERMNLSPAAKEYVRGVTAELLDRDQQHVAGRLQKLCVTGDETRFSFDLLAMAHAGDWRGVNRRIEQWAGKAHVISGTELASAVSAPINSETFVTWEEGPEFPPETDWLDWMLFLHPKQIEVAKKEYTGPARLRGVSGSGKTSVIVHRAKCLAQRYCKPVIVLTLTSSTKQLLDQLIRELSGPEITYIQTMTVSSFAAGLVMECGTSEQRRRSSYASRDILANLYTGALASLRLPDGNLPTFLPTSTGTHPRNFVRDEIKYVRSRLMPAEYDSYLSADTFERIGRGRPLNADARSRMLKAIKDYDESLTDHNSVDSESMIHNALVAMRSVSSHPALCRWRCVLVDEVQDLSQLELTMLAGLRTPDGALITDAPDGLFLVGDGAQTIYKKGFRLIRSGIRVTGSRSVAFTKNYRNTREILTAAYELIRTYQFADVDEESIGAPLQPEFAARRGERPWIIECPKAEIEFRFVASHISDLKTKRTSNAPLRIAVIAASRNIRMSVEDALAEVGIPTTEDVGRLSSVSEPVFVSTIESAKGHEFSHVYLPGLIEGVLPQTDEMNDSGLSREAARLYVAMTRARDYLYMIYSTEGSQMPSRFLTNMRSACDVYFNNGYILEAIQ